MKDCLHAGAGTCRNADMIEDLQQEIERIRVALGGYWDSDLVSLATTICTRAEYVERERDALRAALTYFDHCAMCQRPKTPEQLSGICDHCYEEYC